MKTETETIRNTSEVTICTEFECEFVESVDTLINPSKLRTLSHNTPVVSNEGLICTQDLNNKDYVMTV
ncbi:MAG: hypothetical protein CM15mV18_1210 [uncultured marine virus]|nr:MAG: hypothetical protein CM15mV18_1210 [uncultured marine virus]